MRDFGYVVSRNKPYAGGFITEHYGNPAAGLHAIQLEINRALYMDERRYQKSATFHQAGEPNSRFWPIAWRRFRWRNCGPTGQRPNKPEAGGKPAASAKKKGRSQCKRPKSREETPKEGDGSGR